MNIPVRFTFLASLILLAGGVVCINAGMPSFLSTFDSLPAWPEVPATAPELKTNPENVELRIGDDSLVVKFTLDGIPAEVNCNWSQPTLDSFATVAPLQTKTKEIKITPKNKATPVDSPPVLLCQHATAGLLSVPVKIKSKSEGTFVVEGTATKPTVLNLIAGQTIKLTAVPSDVAISEVVDVETVDVQKDSATGQWIVTAKKAGTAELKAVSGGQNVKLNGADKVAVTVVAFSVAPGAAVLTGSPGTPLNRVVTSPPVDFEPTVPLEYAAADSLLLQFDKPNKQFLGKVATEIATVNVRNSVGTGSFAPATFTVRIVERVGAITIHGTTNTIYVGGPRTLLTAQLQGADGSFASAQPLISWSLVTPSDNQYVSLVNQSGGSVEVNALKAPSDPNYIVRIRAHLAGTTLGGSDITPAEFALWVRGERNVVDFQTIQVRIDMLDGRTAKDLFGPVAPQDYHISKIRIVNDTKEPPAGPGSSIIFFSDALEVRVALEKRHREGKVWLPLTEDDIYYINNWDRCPSAIDLDRDETVQKAYLMRACSLDLRRQRAECDFEFAGESDPNIRSSKITACKARADLTYMACERRVEMSVKEGSCPDDDYECKYRYRFCRVNQGALWPINGQQPAVLNTQWIPFRPYLYQIVANTHDRRDERSLRSRIFLGAEIAASGTSFFTSFLRLPPGSDLPAGLDKYQNLLLPTARKLFPSMREVYRQNIISEVLPPIVDLPYGSDVSKYVFFPKRKIEGVLPDHDVRIVSISSHLIRSRVGIVQKGNLGPRL